MEENTLSVDFPAANSGNSTVEREPMRSELEWLVYFGVTNSADLDLGMLMAITEWRKAEDPQAK